MTTHLSEADTPAKMPPSPVPAPVPSGAAGKAAGVESSGWSRSSSGGHQDCACDIEAEGTRHEVRILNRACPRHGDDRPAYPGAPTRTSTRRTPVPAVEVGTSSFLPPLADLRAAASVTPRAERAVWLMDDHGQLLHPMGQAVTTAQELAEQTVRAAALVEHGHAADIVVLLVGAGARDEELHVRALVECLDRTAHEPALPGRGPYAQVPR